MMHGQKNIKGNALVTRFEI